MYRPGTLTMLECRFNKTTRHVLILRRRISRRGIQGSFPSCVSQMRSLHESSSRSDSSSSQAAAATDKTGVGNTHGPKLCPHGGIGLPSGAGRPDSVQRKAEPASAGAFRSACLSQRGINLSGEAMAIGMPATFT